jgi:hypothetical protein
MMNALTNEYWLESDEQQDLDSENCEVVNFSPEHHVRESLSENFINELEAWARHALAGNGFGDY